jgi:transmembrane sensor
MAAEPSPSGAARAEAAVWLARLHADDAGPADEAGFRDWLAEHPDNARAFEAATQAWNAVGGLRDLDRRFARRVGRRRILEAMAATVLVGAGLGFWRAAHAGVYETGLGEQRRLTLEDGSELLLDTDTRIRVRMDPSRRTVELARGRVNCRVAEDPMRPFVVDAGIEKIVASGPSVDVRREAEQVSVVCLQGNAEVASPAAAPQKLSAGQRLKTSSARPATLDRPALAPLAAWQNGQAIFDDTTLADAIREMNRYGRLPLELGDPKLAGLRISGVYHVGDSGAFAQSIASLLPVEIERDGEQIRLVPRSGEKSARGG